MFWNYFFFIDLLFLLSLNAFFARFLLSNHILFCNLIGYFYNLFSFRNKMRLNSCISLVLCAFTLLSLSQSSMRLLSKDWVLRVNDGVYPAQVPSTVIDMLIKNQVLPSDFYYRDNFLRAYQYETKDSTYTLNFFVSQQQQNAKYQSIVFEGLDTHCEVFLNNRKILESHNMFRRYEVSVSLQKLNNLIVKFYSAANHDLAMEKAFVEKYGFNLPANYSFSRKAAYHYGWDWGPRVCSQGIWKQVYLNCYNDSRIVDLSLKQETQITPSSQYILSSINIELDRLDMNSHYLLELSVVNSSSQQRVFSQQLEILKVSQFKNSFQWNITQNVAAHIWWVWELGNQPLFTLEAKLIHQQTKQTTGKIIQGIGFRTVKLNQAQSQGGKQFTINLNGLDIYCRGGNYIPPEMSLAKTTPNTYKTVIKNARQQNFNMIRVWGGGQFEKDEFYLECDKSGILIWHDLMFACALYPYDDVIAEDIEQEMRDNLRRLRHHPSLGLWNGNNQVWIGWQQWGWKNDKTEQQKQLIQNMYKGIFQISLPKVINQITPQIPYWQTSPSVSSNSLDSIKSGDIHFWRVWGAGTPIQEYNTFIGRFNSQYGMQSMPDISTIQNFTAPEDRTTTSYVMRLHERHPLGDKYLPIYVSNNTHSSQNLTRFSYFSQVMQSYALELATTSLRGNKPYNMGSLYWQLNDVWPVSSWATIDYLQVKKAAHYRIKQIYEPLKVAAYDPQPQTLGKYIIYAVNDYNKRFTCHFEINIIAFTGQVLNTTSVQKTIQPMSRTLIAKMFTTPLELKNLKDIYTSAFMRIDMNCIQKESRSYNFFFINMKNRTVVDPVLTYEYSKTNKTVKVSTKNIATYVWIYSYVPQLGRHFAFKNIEDNYFTLLPGQSRTINLGAFQAQAENGISVTCYEIEALKEIKIKAAKLNELRTKIVKELDI